MGKILDNKVALHLIEQRKIRKKGQSSFQNKIPINGGNGRDIERDVIIAGNREVASVIGRSLPME